MIFRPDEDAEMPGAEDRFGTVEGEVRIEGRHHRVATRALASTMEGLVSSSPTRVRITVPASPWGSLTLKDDSSEPLARHDCDRLIGALVGAPRGHNWPRPLRATFALGLAAAAGTLELDLADANGASLRLVGTLERLIPVRRPGRAGTVLETTYAMFRVDGRHIGWAEVTIVELPDAVGDASEA